MKSRPDLIINADDVGLHPAIDIAVERCIVAGVVNSVSIISHGPYIDYVLVRKWQAAGIAVGIHISLLGVAWITQQYHFKGWPDFTIAFLTRGDGFRQEVYTEIEAQITHCMARSIMPTHIDSHQHIHHLPFLWPHFKQMQKKYGISRIRCARAVDLLSCRASMGGFALQALAALRFSTDHYYAGCIKYAGTYNVERLKKEILRSKGKRAELIVHPGIDNKELNRHYADWGFDWEQETNALLNPLLRDVIRDR